MRRAGSTWGRLLLVGVVLAGTLMIRASLASARAAVVHGRVVADTYASASHPNRPHGGKLRLYAEASRFKAYVKFSVSGIPAGSTPSKTVLQLFATRASRGGFNVYRTTSSWRESRLTWRHKPRRIGRPLASVRAVAARGPLRIRLTRNPVTANGTYSFVLVGTASHKVYLASRETSRHPRLDVTVPASAPSEVSPPTITGQPTVGQQLSATAGRWDGTQPITYRYQWLSCASSTACTNATGAGATTSTYTPAATDAGRTLAVAVTATNSSGSAVGRSAPTAPVAQATTTADPVIAAAGDISCDPTSGSFNGGDGTSNACRQKYTAALVQAMHPAAVLDLGDNQYYCGSYPAYEQVYSSTWGQFLGITHPAPGNHEYLTSGGTGCDSSNAHAAGYFKYFGSRAGSPSASYYSFDVGAWHLISLNSACSLAGGCDASSPQGRWLASDLAADTAKCTLAYWHVPLYSSGGRASSAMQSIWTQLYKAKADVVLTGHDHIYERFAPQNAAGGLDTANGIRQFVAGTGGANHTSIEAAAANSEVRDASTFGVLQLTLHPTSFDWRFVPDTGSGGFTDSGSGTCH